MGYRLLVTNWLNPMSWGEVEVKKGNLQLQVSMIVFVAAAVVSVPIFAAAARTSATQSRNWALLQSAAVALLGIAGIVGAITDDRTAFRIAFGVLAVGAAVRLALIPRQARRRAVPVV